MAKSMSESASEENLLSALRARETRVIQPVDEQRVREIFQEEFTNLLKENSDVLADLDWNRLRTGDYRALNPDNQWAFDAINGQTDAQKWGSALNEASWELIEGMRKALGTALPTPLFNNAKTMLRQAILVYEERIRKDRQK